MSVKKSYKKIGCSTPLTYLCIQIKFHMRKKYNKVNKDFRIPITFYVYNEDFTLLKELNGTSLWHSGEYSNIYVHINKVSNLKDLKKMFKILQISLFGEHSFYDEPLLIENDLNRLERILSNELKENPFVIELKPKEYFDDF